MSAEEKYCDEDVCYSDYNPCNWSKWKNPLDHQFPDGSFQTCVGAQIRCGCTTTMRLISYVTYEHPTAVSVTFLILLAMLLIAVFKCIVTQRECDVICCLLSPPVNDKNLVVLSPNLTAETSFENFEPDYIEDNATRIEEPPTPRNIHIYVIETHNDKPPCYTCVMMQDVHYNKPPPCYSDCIKT